MPSAMDSSRMVDTARHLLGHPALTSAPRKHDPFDTYLAELVNEVVEKLAARAEGILVRLPLRDPNTPDTSDLDFLVFASVDALLPARLALNGTRQYDCPIDLIWLPVANLDKASDFAANGVLPHRLLGSEVVWDRSGRVAEFVSDVRRQFDQPAAQRRRLHGFSELARYAVEEIGISWDFPPIALFWLHMAHAACLAMAVDGTRGLCANVYTRPFDYLPNIDATGDFDISEDFEVGLRLDVDPSALVEPLRGMHRIVTQRCPEPDWPAAMRPTTRYEYRYFSSHRELEWRLRVADELTRKGQHPAAVFYLRFWAYSLARVAMVHRRAAEGRDVSFVRPARAVRPDLAAYCPDLLPPLEQILSGGKMVTIDDIQSGVERLRGLRNRIFDNLSARSIELPDRANWEPCKPPPTDAQRRPECVPGGIEQ